MIEIIILAILAFFIFKKLKSILGEEYDEQMFGYGASNKKRKIKDAEQIEQADEFTDNLDGEEFKNLSAQAKAHYKTLCDNINHFSLFKFKTIVEKVMSIALKANEEQDKDMVKKLFSRSLAETIIQSFTENSINHIILIEIDNLSIANISKKNNIYTIQVDCKTKQINYTTERESGNIIDGDKKEIVSVNERWSFSHDITSNDNTWFIEKIEAI